MIKLIAIACIFLAAIWLGRGYSSFCDRRVGEMAGIVALISYMEEGISSTLSFGSELYRGFYDEYLDKSGFLAAIKENNLSESAFDMLNLPKEIKEKIKRLFSEFGSGYMENELSKLRSCREELSADLASLEADLEREKKVTGALIFGFAASLGIILI